jgi:protein-disulfide isomerase
VVKQLLQTHPGDVKVVFKHFPLPNHPSARPAAIASVAAQRQNRFWEMHDLLFNNQRALDAASLKRYAQSLGLDMEQYERDIADPAVARFVDQEAQEAGTAGVRGTPTFFVQGVRSPSWDFNTLNRLVKVAKAGGDVGKESAQVLADLRNRQAQARANRPQVDFNKVYQIDTEGAPFKGPANAPITIVEFSDYQ